MIESGALGVEKLSQELVGLVDFPNEFLEIATGKRYPYSILPKTRWGTLEYSVRRGGRLIPAWRDWMISKDRLFVRIVCRPDLPPLSLIQGHLPVPAPVGRGNISKRN